MFPNCSIVKYVVSVKFIPPYCVIHPTQLCNSSHPIVQFTLSADGQYIVRACVQNMFPPNTMINKIIATLGLIKNNVYMLLIEKFNVMHDCICH